MLLSEEAFPKAATLHLKLTMPSSSAVIWLRLSVDYCPLFQLPYHRKYQVHESPELFSAPTDTLHH